MIGADDAAGAVQRHAEGAAAGDGGAQVRLLGGVELDVPGPAVAAADAGEVRVMARARAAQHEQVGCADLGGDRLQRLCLGALAGLARRPAGHFVLLAEDGEQALHDLWIELAAGAGAGAGARFAHRLRGAQRGR